MASEVQKKMSNELEKFKSLQTDYQKYVKGRQQLDGQLNENSSVKEELDLIESSAAVFKMIGPVLVKQDIEEARQNVQKRIDYINGEIKRHDGLIKDIEKKQETQRDILQKLQTQYQHHQQKAVKS